MSKLHWLIIAACAAVEASHVLAFAADGDKAHWAIEQSVANLEVQTNAACAGESRSETRAQSGLAAFRQAAALKEKVKRRIASAQESVDRSLSDIQEAERNRAWVRLNAEVDALEKLRFRRRSSREIEAQRERVIAAKREWDRSRSEGIRDLPENRERVASLSRSRMEELRGLLELGDRVDRLEDRAHSCHVIAAGTGLRFLGEDPDHPSQSARDVLSRAAASASN